VFLLEHDLAKFVAKPEPQESQMAGPLTSFILWVVRRCSKAREGGEGVWEHMKENERRRTWWDEGEADWWVHRKRRRRRGRYHATSDGGGDGDVSETREGRQGAMSVSMSNWEVNKK
jgi:hypothetical protein